MRIAYIDWNPRGSSLDLVSTAEQIIKEYSQAGYILTLRQLYYQFVARDIVANSEKSYKNLGAIITKARMAGMLDWDAIEDRNREHHAYHFEENSSNVIHGLEFDINFDQWARQEHYVEVWVEKEALGNVIARACERLHVSYMACKGYLSASEAWRAGRRFRRKSREGKRCVMVHLGDHDPSGIDMTRDNDERLELFGEHPVEVRRIALNMDQVEEYDPPPNPTKVQDSRADKYIEEHGHTSWELDALEPKVIEGLISNEIEPLIDRGMWDKVLAKQAEEREVLSDLSDNWDAVSTMIRNGEF